MMREGVDMQYAIKSVQPSTPRVLPAQDEFHQMKSNIVERGSLLCNHPPPHSEQPISISC